MTWYAHHIFLPAISRALEALDAANLGKHVFCVKNIEDFPWHDPRVKHSLGPHGLIVVRPVAPSDGHHDEWYDDPILPWNSLHPRNGTVPAELCIEDESCPPKSLLQFVRELSELAEVPAAYYTSSWWGGDVEFEAAWVFADKQYTYVTKTPVGNEATVRRFVESGPESVIPGDTLQHCLSHLGIDLPTGFFAPHTRSFPWGKHRVA